MPPIPLPLDEIRAARATLSAQRDDQRAQMRPGEGIDTVCDDAQGIDIQARIGLIQNGYLGFEGGHLQDLGALLLAAGETVVQVSPGKSRIHLEHFHLLLEHIAELEDRDALILRVIGMPAGIHSRAQEICHRYTRDGNRVLERQEQAQARALVCL